MANTEGLTDEEMLSSMQATVTDWETETSSSRPTTTSIPLAERLERRGGRGQPAAKVVRKSKRISVPTDGKVYNTNTTSESTRIVNEQAASEMQTQSPEATVILGDVVERQRGTKGRRRRQQQQHQSLASSAQEATKRQGFPSVRKPLGTFTPKGSTTTTTTAVASGRVFTSATTSKVATVPPTANASSDTTLPTQPKDDAASSDNMNSIDNLKQASAREADQMLAEMSNDEIRQSTTELQGTLSSATLAFLKQRGQTKTSTAKEQKSISTPVAPQSTSVVDRTDGERREKERVAHLLASVQTYDDMDALYQAETGQTSEWVPDQEEIADPFAVACDLLRSTAPRQTLWAVRTVRDSLNRDYRDRPHALRLPNASQAWPYPTLLPVSLRCLLDESPHRVNGFSLHTYALEAIYLLLRLRCAEEHDIDLTSTHVSLNDDATGVYQLVLGQDAVPVRPTSSLYSSSNVQPLSVGEHEHVAYATASSSTSAIQDGNKFVNDPLWTLLSQMRLIPRLAVLLQYDLPEEAVLALVGILAMIAQRSPGASTAMVQHKTLLHDVARVAWGAEDENTPKKALESVQLSVVRFWTIVVRQSRTAAADLELPPWGMFLGTTQIQALQRWTLVLWRTLLRYGLLLHELEALLTLASPRLALFHVDDSGLTADYVSCFTVVLQVYHDRALKAPDSETLDHQSRQLIRVRAWLASWYRQAQAYLLEDRSGDSVGDADAMILDAACLDFCREYISAGVTIITDASGEFKSEVPTAEDHNKQLEALQRFVSDGTLARSVESISHFFLPKNGVKILARDEGSHVRFISAFCRSTWMLYMKANGAKEGGFSLQTFRELSASVSALVTKALTDFDIEAGLSSTSPSSHVHLGWQNRGHVMLLELIRLTCRKEDIALATRISMGVLAISRFQVGDESLANRTLRLDVIGLPLNLRSMILAQLYSSEQKKSQMEHSVSLNSDYLLDDQNLSSLQSLRSEADLGGPHRDESDSSILPLGNYWVWKILAGSSSPGTPSMQVVQILTSALSVLCELEGTGGTENPASNGSKAYFLLNVCLQPEEVLGDETMGTLFSRLLAKLLGSVDSYFVRAFADSCVGHSSVPILENASKDVSEEEKKLAEALLEERQDPSKVLSGKNFRVVMDFVNDLCTNFCNYGAQYPFFGTCFRVFLYPAFPSKIRCEILTRLQGLLHLVFLPDEDPDILADLWKTPQLDGDTLDTLALSYAKSSPNRFEGLVYYYAIGALATSLRWSAKQGKVESQRRRLQGLHPTILSQVAHWAYRELTVNGGENSIHPAYLLEQANQQKDSMSWDHVLELFS